MSRSKGGPDDEGPGIRARLKEMREERASLRRDRRRQRRQRKEMLKEGRLAQKDVKREDRQAHRKARREERKIGRAGRRDERRLRKEVLREERQKPRRRQPEIAIAFPRPAELEARTTDAILARYCAARAKVVGGNEAAPLRDGAEAYPAMLEAIDRAKEYVNLETYIFQSDETGWRFAEALAKAAERGVEVNLLYDAIGCLDTDRRLFDFMEKSGVRLLVFRPPAPWRRRWGVNRRDHRKILVVDGRRGFAGGLNIGDDYAPKEWGGEGWRDTHMCVEGPAVRELQKLFVRNWQREGGPHLDPQIHLRPAHRVVSHVPVRVLANNMRKDRRSIRRAYLHAIRRARRSVYIANAYFIPDRGIRRALRNAAKRGVDVRVMISGESDLKSVWYATRNIVGALLGSGIRIFEWRPEVLHSKTAVIDGSWATVGSYNLDMRSLVWNLEVSVSVYDRDFGITMNSMFLDDLMYCQEMHLEAHRKRPWWQKLLERFFYFLRYWL
jgi:cardiolipin synthase